MIKLKRLELENFRGFEKTAVDFTERFTCIAGINGSGKTTILSAIQKSMLIFLNANHLGSYRNPKYALNAADVHIDENTTFLEQNKIVFSKLIFSIDDIDSVIEHSFEKIGRTGKYYSSSYNGNDFKDAKNCPIFAFYSINRRNVSTSKQNQNSLAGFDNIFAAWEHVNLVNFDCFFDWYKNELLDEYQIKDENPSYINNELRAVRNAISSFFGDSIKLKIVKNQLIAVKNGVELLFSNISDGEKSLVLLFADIARRLAIANPNFNNPLEGAGVILIDEIELHLHPSWQRKACKALKETFPNCQFVITTHSPQVLGELQPKEIRLLDNFRISIPTQSYGLTSNSIIKKLMGNGGIDYSQNESVSRKLREIEKCITDGRFKEAKNLLIKLDNTTHGSTSESVELMSVLTTLFGVE